MSFAEPFLHVDMDAFFVEVERVDEPELRGVPVVVGGLGERGVVASASYEARRAGVHSAMPMGAARRLCPTARFLPPRHDRYREVSAAVFDLLGSYTPLVQGLSLDEAFLDVSGLHRHWPGPSAIASDIRSRLRSELELPASVGIAPNMFLAKLASETAKPDGTFVVEKGHELEFLHRLGVRRLWGVGEATYAGLEALGIETIGDLAATPAAALASRVGPAAADMLAALARGEDHRTVTVESVPKSISIERTFGADIVGSEAVGRELLRQSDRLADRLRRAQVAARTISLKVRYRDFTTITRSITLGSAVDTTRGIHEAARHLGDRVQLGRHPIRLLGLGAGGLTGRTTPRQLLLADGPRWDEVSHAVEAVRDRYGPDAVGPARLVDRGGPD